MICLGVALLLFVVELFVPSGGLLGVLAGASAIAGIILLFKINTTLGLVGALIGVAGLPFLVAFAIRIWPQTPIARMLTHKDSGAGTDAFESVSPAGEPIVVGDEGQAVSDLRPVGVCLLRGRRVDCLAESGLIRAETKVRVVSVDGIQVKVREIED